MGRRKEIEKVVLGVQVILILNFIRWWWVVSTWICCCLDLESWPFWPFPYYSFQSPTPTSRSIKPPPKILTATFSPRSRASIVRSPNLSEARRSFISTQDPQTKRNSDVFTQKPRAVSPGPSSALDPLLLSTPNSFVNSLLSRPIGNQDQTQTPPSSPEMELQSLEEGRSSEWKGKGRDLNGAFTPDTPPSPYQEFKWFLEDSKECRFVGLWHFSVVLSLGTPFHFGHFYKFRSPFSFSSFCFSCSTSLFIDTFHRNHFYLNMLARIPDLILRSWLGHLLCAPIQVPLIPVNWPFRFPDGLPPSRFQSPSLTSSY